MSNRYARIHHNGRSNEYNQAFIRIKNKIRAISCSLLTLLALIRLPCVLDQCRDGHRSDASWNGRYGLHIAPQVLIVSVSSSDSIDKSRTNINNDRFF
jgi:hypothetical protein